MSPVDRALSRSDRQLSPVSQRRPEAPSPYLDRYLLPGLAFVGPEEPSKDWPAVVTFGSSATSPTCASCYHLSLPQLIGPPGVH